MLLQALRSFLLCKAYIVPDKWGIYHMIYDIDIIKAAIVRSADKAIYFKSMLTLLDNYSGDGDMGISVEKGCLALKEIVHDFDDNDIGSFFDECARRFNQVAASTIGTLLSSAFQMLGKKFAGKINLNDNDILMIPEYMSDAIAMRGHASLGNKTLLDALIPFSHALLEAFEKCQNINEAGKQAAKVAKEAAKSTRGMIATIGRAKWFGQRSKDYLDPGAVLCSLIIDAIVYPQESLGYKLPNYESHYNGIKDK